MCQLNITILIENTDGVKYFALETEEKEKFNIFMN